jgi:hypothetical protein
MTRVRRCVIDVRVHVRAAVEMAHSHEPIPLFLYFSGLDRCVRSQSAMGNSFLERVRHESCANAPQPGAVARCALTHRVFGGCPGSFNGGSPPLDLARGALRIVEERERGAGPPTQ